MDALAIILALAATPPTCVDDTMREEVRALMKAGLQDALRAQATSLFRVWMQDVTNQPQRAQAGVDQAVAAYVRSVDLVNQWNPPACP